MVLYSSWSKSHNEPFIQPLILKGSWMHNDHWLPLIGIVFLVCFTELGKRLRFFVFLIFFTYDIKCRFPYVLLNYGHTHIQLSFSTLWSFVEDIFFYFNII